MRQGAPGDVIGGKYCLLSELGQGGTGTVWRANHLTLESQVAIKLIDPIVALGPEARRRFLGEARAAAAIRSAHVVQILDYGVDGDTPYIAMEILEGESLAERVKRCGRLTAAEAAPVIRQVSRALRRAHEAGIVHRDLKPENIFVVNNDDDTVIKVLDFGVAKLRLVTFSAPAASMATRSGTLMGTPYFMSPEQAYGVRSVDLRADIWALGVIAFECLLGELPFKGDSVGRVVLAVCSDPLPVPSEFGDVPVGFDGWFARACARDLAARFQSAKQAADAFNELASAVREEPGSRVGLRPVPISSRAPESGPTSVNGAAAGAPGERARASGRLGPIAPLLGIAGLLIVASIMGVAPYWFRASPARVASTPVGDAAPPRNEQASAPAAPAIAAQAAGDEPVLDSPAPTQTSRPAVATRSSPAHRPGSEASRSPPVPKDTERARSPAPKARRRMIDLGI